MKNFVYLFISIIVYGMGYGCFTSIQRVIQTINRYRVEMDKNLNYSYNKRKSSLYIQFNNDNDRKVN